jgi:diguanylate cyclase (GGDEF)-like protein
MNSVRAGRYAGIVAIATVIALVATPIVFQRTVARQRSTYVELLDPAREAASDVRLSVARQVAAIRGFLLTQDRELLAEYRVARLAQDEAFVRLTALSRPDSALRAHAAAVETATRSWNAMNDRLLSGAITVAQARRQMDSQQDMYTAALNAGETLESSIVADINRRRNAVGALERQWAGASVVLAILAAVAAAVVIFMMRMSHRQSALARTDSLTALYNRLGFDELAGREFNRAKRNATRLTLITFDVDDFKLINDRRGHAAGDDLLRGVGDGIRSAIRDVDIGARLGGDEFAVLLTDNRAVPPELAVERVRRVITNALAGQWSVNLSMGAVTVDAARVSIDAMLHHSDTLMYRVKNAGKNAMLHEVLQ